MIVRLLLGVALLGGAAFAGPVVVHKVAEYRVRSGLVEAGVAPRVASCMARRMVDRLTITQLRKLEALQGEDGKAPGLISGIRKVGDAEVVSVTGTSSFLCRIGLAKESKG
ncbi:hypothetical protein [Novosphingobium lentum]|uniref:hypothetical protein n=1 Tax=Novosphingobium lentum TaxID=145287 RepID=UPI00082961BB|nr:hypothetical protein [Novosphingobium lentum]